MLARFFYTLYLHNVSNFTLSRRVAQEEGKATYDSLWGLYCLLRPSVPIAKNWRSKWPSPPLSPTPFCFSLKHFWITNAQLDLDIKARQLIPLCFTGEALVQTGWELPLIYRDTVTEVRVTYESHLGHLSKSIASIGSIKWGNLISLSHGIWSGKLASKLPSLGQGGLAPSGKLAAGRKVYHPVAPASSCKKELCWE